MSLAHATLEWCIADLTMEAMTPAQAALEWQRQVAEAMSLAQVLAALTLEAMTPAQAALEWQRQFAEAMSLAQGLTDVTGGDAHSKGTSEAETPQQAIQIQANPKIAPSCRADFVCTLEPSVGNRSSAIAMLLIGKRPTESHQTISLNNLARPWSRLPS